MKKEIIIFYIFCLIILNLKVEELQKINLVILKGNEVLC